MYNFLSSFHKTSDAVKVFIDVINMLQKGDFLLTKFILKNRLILQALPKNNVSPKLTEINHSVNDVAIMKLRNKYISYKICTQISLRYQMKYPISNKFYF